MFTEENVAAAPVAKRESLFNLDISPSTTPVENAPTPPNEAAVSLKGSGDEVENLISEQDQNVSLDTPQEDVVKVAIDENIPKEDDVDDQSNEPVKPVEYDDSQIFEAIVAEATELEGVDINLDGVQDLPSFISAIEADVVDKRILTPGTDLYDRLVDVVKQDYGITDAHIAALENEKYGFDGTQYSGLKQIHTFVSNSITMENPAAVKELFKAHYMLDNASAENAERFASMDMKDEGNIASLIGSRQAAVKAATDAKISAMDAKIGEMRQKQRDHSAKILRESTDMMNSRVVNNKTYTAEDISYYKDFVKPKTVEIVLPTGVTMKVSKMQKLDYEMSTGEKLQRSMDLALMSKNGISSSEINKSIENKKVTGSIAQRLAASTKKKADVISAPRSAIKNAPVKPEDEITISFDK